MSATFTKAHLDALRAQMKNVTRVDPCGETYLKMEALLKGMEPAMLKSIANADINFLSYMAQKFLPKKSPLLVPACGGTEREMTVKGRRVLYCWDKNQTGTFPGDHVYLNLDTDTPLTQEETETLFNNY